MEKKLRCGKPGWRRINAKTIPPASLRSLGFEEKERETGRGV